MPIIDEPVTTERPVIRPDQPYADASREFNDEPAPDGISI
jgi:hypothetical protein